MLDSDDIELLFDALPDAILLCDFDGRIRSCNRRLFELLGYTREELEGRPIEILVTEAWRGRHERLRQAYASAPRLRGMNQLQGIMALHRDGSEVAVTVGLAPVQSLIMVSLREDKGLGSSALHPDKLADTQLQRLESLGLLACGVAHDIRNLLTVVVGHAEWIARGLEAEHPLQNSTKAIVLAATHLSRLSQQVMTFAGGREEQPRPIRLNDLVLETAAMLGTTLPTGIRIQPGLADGLPPLLAAPDQVVQILLNLVMNAADAMTHSGGAIRIETGRLLLDAHLPCEDRVLSPASSGQHLWLRVSDDGHGMSDALRRSIFAPFYGTHGKGRGLGLTLVHSIVVRLGGGICLSSAPGRGTRFTIYFPVVDDMSAALPEPTSHAPGHPCDALSTPTDHS